MGITEYGMAAPVGYGFNDHDDSLVYRLSEAAFQTGLDIVARSRIVTDTRRHLTWKPDKIAYRPGDDWLYIVFDGAREAWYEYFSGLRVSVADGSSRLHGPEYDVDFHKDKVPSGALSVIYVHRCDSARFACLISEYKNSHTERQIRNHVKRLNAMAEDALRWRQRFDALVAEVKDERVRKEAVFRGKEAELAAGFGQYGDSPLKRKKGPFRRGNRRR